MKKYILMLAVASAAALVACGGNKEAQTEETVAAEVVEAVEVVDSAADCCADTAACCADTAACCADSTVVAE